MAIDKIGVVGAGTMGNGIAQALAVAGCDVVMMDVGEAQLKRGLDTISASLDRLIKKEKMSAEQKATAMAHISTAGAVAGLAECDLVIEAATENVDLKLRIFADLDKTLKPEAILASNTSSISITRLAAATQRPGQVIGMHFFNPVPLMALVELINGLQTSAGTYAAVEELAKSIGKTPIKVKNSPGFVVNRMLCPMINEAVFALGEGLATAAEIDEAMKLGCNHPIGPLALCDLIGLDVELAVMQVLYEGTKDPKYRPAPLLVEMLEAGYLGRKSGKGFFEYPAK
ncbi:3-hydroxybutyryl-CoA dehydrogenase [Thauera sp. GDN1]|uniref:3-hydroxybutyryl-CoA dehydrogenase n=1 Tax=Thauera sp. GDN1 TaxID=2944810 RepID=UPI002478D343|nr:3-hydroxybutyryl-CoA dehydrogenase [Thauera sp. GDN1]WEN41696.1 3-hydroxybutyryl-CoA dehydrogenase [Thauera sp. GDN1]